jgi:hypothetical protein
MKLHKVMINDIYSLLFACNKIALKHMYNLFLATRATSGKQSEKPQCCTSWQKKKKKIVVDQEAGSPTVPLCTTKSKRQQCTTVRPMMCLKLNQDEPYWLA